MYIHVSSDRSTAYFSNNTSTSFRVKLPYAINLGPTGKYKVGLVQIRTPSVKGGYVPKYVTINTNLCEPSVINLSLRSILRRMHPEELGKPVDFAAPQYLNMMSHSLDLIDLYLTDDTGAEPSFDEGAVYATLHIIPEE